MPLLVVEAIHVRVVCDSCRSASAELCGRRDLAVSARVTAASKFRAHGWHHDPGTHARVRALEQAERDGSGRWYCPACARQTHL
jgi:hypothetical protein